MKEILEAYLGGLKVGGKQVHKNLALFPLLSTYSVDLEYLLLDEALKGDVIEVKEVSEEGSVPELEVVNRSPQMILILDAEELVGARQNRIVNTTILVAGHTTLVIPVSCVEQGRWAYSSPRFSSEERLMCSDLRAMKAEQVHESLKTFNSYRSDQGVIWEKISEKADRRNAQSPSMAMSEIFEKEKDAFEAFLKDFRVIDSQVGALFMINGRVAGLDSFGKPETFSKVFRKLLESYTLNAIEWYEPGEKSKVLKSRVTEFLNLGSEAEVETHRSVGSGTDYRLSSKKIAGSALCLDSQVLHLSIFPRKRGKPSC